MRRRPSPSLVLSIIAVVFSLAGTSVAAITYVRNAGAVDHAWIGVKGAEPGDLVAALQERTSGQRVTVLTGYDTTDL